MKNIIKFFLILVGFLLCLSFAVLWYHDFFTASQVVEMEIGPYTVATKKVTGSYYNVGPMMSEVDMQLRELGVNSTKGIGLYYDDPAKVEQSKLRSDIGNILENIDEETMGKIKEKLDVREIQKQNAVVVRYPIKSPLSYMLGAIKAYPAISAYWIQKAYPMDVEGSFGLEIYDIPGKVTLYIMPIPEK